MLNHEKHKHIVQARRSKARITHQAKLALSRHSGDSRANSVNTNNWYQERKRASQRVSSLSNGKIALIENGYRGHHRRHWFKDLRCEHVFRASLRELAYENAKNACPFCSPIHDLRRYGSVAAVQELVLLRSENLISFSPDNSLGSRNDLYTFCCDLDGILLETDFASFVDCDDYSKFCPVCAFR